MTRTQAIKIYLARLTHAEIMIRRIMLWDPNLTIPDNAKSLKIDYHKGLNLVDCFNLKYKHLGTGKNYRKGK